jgi:hypothetical protein
MEEALNKRFHFEIRVGNILGIRMVRGTMNINHSQFADDTLLLGGASIVIVS